MRKTFVRCLWGACGLWINACSSFDQNHQNPSAQQRRQLRCLAEAIYGEARGESEAGQLFVGQVVLTRLRDGYGKNYCDIVYSPRQFAPKKNANLLSYKAARRSEELGPNDITHFHSYKTKWTPQASFSTTPRCEYRKRVGGHWGFYCHERRPQKRDLAQDNP